MPTHKKGHDKDKYYHLAKDQGFRSRAAFKLIQINKRFDFLSKARVCVDLCAAPGGWCQVAAKTMPSGSIVLGIDLLPIRSIRNVKTIVADITTAECRRMVTAELQGWKADVVLCDGAPNIGSAYSKDAYVQNELVLAALKTATDHLTEGGTFCTKVYRSVDYNAIVWVLQQLFEDVQPMKPNSSRSQSSEIFLVCLKYTAPKRIDPKLLDPNHVFKEVRDPGLAKVDVLHKKYDKLNKRHRTGYEDALGMTLRASTTVSEFILSTDPVRMLTDVNEFEFSPECDKYKTDPLTTPEMLVCFQDLRVLGKIDFKKILKWRQKMRTQYVLEQKSESGSVKSATPKPKLTEEEQMVQEIEEFREKEEHSQRKEKKKKRLLAAKQRERQALGMSNASFEVGEDMELFAFSNVQAGSNTAEGVEALHDVLHDPAVQDLATEADYNDDEPVSDRGPIIYTEDDLEKQLEEDYQRYLAAGKGRARVSGEDIALGVMAPSKKVKKSTTTSKGILASHQAEDAAALAAMAPEHRLEGDIMSYVGMLAGTTPKVSAKKRRRGDDDDGENEASLDVASSDDSDDDDEDDGFESDDSGEGDDDAKVKIPTGMKAAINTEQWFSHPIFRETVTSKSLRGSSDDGNEDSGKGKGGRRAQSKEASAVEEMMAQMPKTDKELRKEKRKKALERQERKAKRRETAVDEEARATAAFEITPSQDQLDARARKTVDVDGGGGSGSALSAEQRDLLKRGMGKLLKDKDVAASEKGKVSFEVVPEEVLSEYDMGKGDDRVYDSDNEDYDASDRVMTLALGTLMLRNSRKKALVDASYNRFAWNDPSDLPDWFMEDEAKHNKPQVPVPPALLEQMKSRFQLTGTKEIKKVAEARMRKRKRLANKLKQAKKQANSAVENSEMSEREKMKAIGRAMRGVKSNKPSKVYVVTGRTKAGSSGTNLGGKGQLKFVDKRMKKETRATRAKKKRGKK